MGILLKLAKRVCIKMESQCQR